MTHAHLLTCGCGATISVAKGQAGGRVACPQCGTRLDVPRLGALVRLPAVAAKAGPATTWSVAHGCLLGGGLVAVLGLAAAAYLGSAPRPIIASDVIRAGVSAAPIPDVYRAWLALSRAPVSRPTTPDEERLAQAARSARAVATVLWSMAGIGTVVAIGGGLALARGRRPPS